MPYNLRPLAAPGRWFGPGRVYVMHYVDHDIKYYKIGCSRNPDERLKQIREREKEGGNTNTIDLVDSVAANEMNGAETAAQQTVRAKGLKKNRNRGGTTDWFWCSRNGLSAQDVMLYVKEAVKKHNRQNPSKK